MKRLGRAFVLWGVGLLVVAAGCEEQNKVSKQPQGSKPAAVVEQKKGAGHIEFSNLEYDFGKLRPGEKKSGQFEFKNVGDGVLTITRVDSCCGVKSTLEKKQYGPGESGEVRIDYTGGRRRATIKKTMYVNCDDKDKPRTALIVKAEVMPKVVFEPGTLQLSLVADNAGATPITLESPEGIEFSVSSFKCTGDSLTADFDSSVKATKIVLNLKSDLNKLVRYMNGTIEIEVMCPEPQMLRLSYVVTPRFSAKPPVVAFSYTDPTPVKKYIWVQSNYEEKFKIVSNSSRDGRVKVLETRDDSERHRYSLVLEITPPAAKVERFTDVLQIVLDNNEKLNVLCLGMHKSK